MIWDMSVDALYSIRFTSLGIEQRQPRAHNFWRTRHPSDATCRRRMAKLVSPPLIELKSYPGSNEAANRMRADALLRRKSEHKISNVLLRRSMGRYTAQCTDYGSL